MSASRYGMFFTTHIHMKIIKFDDVRFRTDINLSSDIHAEAFIIAAGHYLSNWPEDWSAAHLFDVLSNKDESSEEQRSLVGVWEGVVHSSMNQGVNEYNYALEHIEGLTLDLIAFAIQYTSDTLFNANNQLNK